MSATADRAEPPVPFGRAVALHSLGWLAAANLVGVWLGVSLLWPAAGDWLAPLTFGRWAPVHMDWQLYGWCSLPLVGALLYWCLDPGHAAVRRHAALALGAWSLALGLGAIGWLGGDTSGKLFLDWHGWTRPLLPLAMLVLWVVLAAHAKRRWAEGSALDRFLRGGMLALLFPVPFVLFWAVSRGVYQSVNPDSGGATGAAVLGSTLGIVTIYMLVPTFLARPAERRVSAFVWALLGSWAVFAVLDRGNVSHHVPRQYVALAVLLLWIPLLPLFWRRYRWGHGARAWFGAAAAWWAILVLTGWLTFLPGMSERLKFTHALVGHAHLAMAGLVTCVNGAILVVLTRRPAPRGVWLAWQVGCALYVVSMNVLGWSETERVAELFRSEAWTQACLAIRLAGGLAMATASLRWLAALWPRGEVAHG